MSPFSQFLAPCPLLCPCFLLGGDSMLLLPAALQDFPPPTTYPSAQTKLVKYSWLSFHGHVLSSISPEVFHLIRIFTLLFPPNFVYSGPSPLLLLHSPRVPPSMVLQMCPSVFHQAFLKALGFFHAFAVTITLQCITLYINHFVWVHEDLWGTFPEVSLLDQRLNTSVFLKNVAKLLLLATHVRGSVSPQSHHLPVWQMKVNKRLILRFSHCRYR